MSIFRRGKKWKIALIVIIAVIALFGFAEIIKEERQLIIVQKPGQETIVKDSQIKQIIKEIERIKASVSGNINKKISIVLDVPFTTQAPGGDWQDQRLQNGCEEAAVLMAMKWVKGETLTEQAAKPIILAMADWEIAKYGSDTDTSAEDTANRLIKGYFKYDKVSVQKLTDSQQIVKELEAGHLVLIPTNGQDLHNPYYKQPGPTTHMLVIRGYSPTSDEFITNDPGTKRGEKYRYSAKVLMAASVDYPTGDHLPQDKTKKAIIIITR